MGRTPAGQTREKVFRFVRDRLAGGDPPTVREVMDAFGFRSPQTAREHLDALIEEGGSTGSRGSPVACGFRPAAATGRRSWCRSWGASPRDRSMRRSKTSKGTSPSRRACPWASCSACA